MAVAPFAAFILYKATSKDFLTTLTLASYFGVVLILFHSSKENPIKFPMYLWFYLFFVLYIFYSTFYQLDREFKMRYLMTNREVGSFNFMFILENIVFSKIYFKRILKISKIVLLIALLVIFIQQTYSINFFIRPDLAMKFASDVGSEDRLDSIYSWLGQNSSGYGFIPVFIIIAELIARKKKSLMIWILLGSVFAILTRARWVMINIFMVFFILIINQKDKLQRVFKYAIIIPLIAIGSYSVLNSVGIDVKGIVEERILESGERSDKKSASTRLLAITVFNKLYWKNAVFGVGNKKYGMGAKGHHHGYELSKLLGGSSSQIHVGYLMLLYMYGIIGGGMFICFLFLITIKLYKDAKITTYWGPFLGFIGFAISNLTLVQFSVYEMGLLFALLANEYYVKQHKEKLSYKFNYS